jgi:hypothetical protein
MYHAKSDNDNCIFHVVLQEATTSVFLCHIANRNDCDCMWKRIFHRISRTWATSRHRHIWLWIAMSKQRWLHFFMFYHKGESEGEIQLRGCGDDSPPPNNQIFKCCWLQWSQQWACIARSDDEDNIFMSWYCTARITAKTKNKIEPPNKQHVLSDCSSDHNNCKGAEAPVIKNVHTRHCRECNSQKYVMLQGAMITNSGWLWWRRTCQATTNQIFSCIAGASNDRKMTTSSTRWSIVCPKLYCKKIRWWQQRLIATVRPTSRYVPNGGKDSRQSHETP